MALALCLCLLRARWSGEDWGGLAAGPQPLNTVTLQVDLVGSEWAAQSSHSSTTSA